MLENMEYPDAMEHLERVAGIATVMKQTKRGVCMVIRHHNDEGHNPRAPEESKTLYPALSSMLCCAGLDARRWQRLPGTTRSHAATSGASLAALPSARETRRSGCHDHRAGIDVFCSCTPVSMGRSLWYIWVTFSWTKPVNTQSLL